MRNLKISLLFLLGSAAAWGVGKTTTQILAGKIINGSGTLNVNSTGTITVPNVTDTLVGKATTDTLTNKTITAPTISTPTVTGQLTGASAGFSSTVTSPSFASNAAIVAATGSLRLPSAGIIGWRNNANSSDLDLTTDTSDNLSWGGTSFLSSSGTLLGAGFPALTGDVTTSAGSLATTVSKIAGVSVGTPSGTGNVAMTTNPVFTTPNLGTPSAIVATNATGTAASLTAGNVSTNHNMTGPITGTGNVTSITSQTGTGSTFVMSAGPTVTGAFTAGTLNTTSGGGVTANGDNVQVTGSDSKGFVSKNGAATQVGFMGPEKGFDGGADVTDLAIASFGPNLKFFTNNAGTLVLNLDSSNNATFAGSLIEKGSSSGAITIATQAASGTYNFNLPTTAGSAGQVLLSQGGLTNAMTWSTVTGTGTVTSVTFTGDGTVLSSTPSSAVTAAGTVTAALKTQTAGTFLAGPTSGSAATPTFRTLQVPTTSIATATSHTGGMSANASGVYTVPAGVLYFTVELQGAGGGGAGDAAGSATSPANTTFSVHGGAAIITSASGNGGVGNSVGTQGLGGAVTFAAGATQLVAVTGGSSTGTTPAVASTFQPGTAGGNSFFGSGGGGGVNANGLGAGVTSGAGGGGGGGGSGNGSGSGGGAGGYGKGLVTSPSASYDYSLSAGGSGAGNALHQGGSGGGATLIITEYYQ